MIIVSRFHDYYDIGRSFGYDPQDVRYVRERKSIYDQVSKWRETIRGVPHSRNFEHRRNGVRIEIYPFRVLFCGKFYNGTQVIESWWTHNKLLGSVYSSLHTYWYSYAAFYQYFLKYPKINWHDIDGYRWDRVRYSEFLKPVPESEYLRKKCIDEGVTILYYQPSHKDENERFVLNRELKNLDFQRIMPPYQAYQEIDMWVSGVLPQPDRPMLTVSDEVKIHKRGFDKWSFRKEGKKK